MGSGQPDPARGVESRSSGREGGFVMSDSMLDDVLIWCCVAALLCKALVIVGLPWIPMLVLWFMLIPVISFSAYRERKQDKVKGNGQDKDQ